MAPRETREPESPSETAADSGAASSTSSPYVAGPGPGFDAGTPPPTPPDAGEEPDVSPFEIGWEQPQVESWLLNGGDLAHAAFGVAENDWAMTKADLERIAPPLTRILNRFEPSRAVAAYSDPAAVAIGFGMYGWRSALERTAALKARQRAEELSGSVTPTAEPADAGEPSDDNHVLWAERLRATRPPEAP